MAGTPDLTAGGPKHKVMARVPKDVSRRQRIPPRGKEAEAETVTTETGSAPGEGASVGKRAGRPPWDKTGPVEGGSFGEWLRRQREMREISLRDIAERTKISLRYLEAMEQDRFDLLPAPIFAKGFLREYARYVGLSPDEVVNHYLAVHQPEEVDDPGDVTLAALERERKRRKKGKGWTWGLFLLLAGLLLLALVGLFSWLAERRENAPSTTPPPPQVSTPSEPVPLPAVTPPQPAALAEAPKAPLEVSLDFSADCWVRVAVDGKSPIEEQRVQGESLQFEGQQSVVVKLGNAAAAEIQVNGYPFEFDKTPGQVVELVIDLETVRALREKREAR
jgi:cytoskeleton protein RodZ